MSESVRVMNLSLDRIRTSKKNPRRNFDRDGIAELAASIRQVGVIQPITVVPTGKYFRIVAGERRFRAAKVAGLKRIPSVIRELSNAEIAKIAFIENLQRRDLDPIEEAHAIDRLMEALEAKVEDLAALLGKSESYVYTRLRLLDLPESVQREVAGGRLPSASAVILTRLKDPVEMANVAFKAVREQLVISQVESLVKDRLHTSQKAGRSVARSEIYDRKLKALRASEQKPVLAYNEFDTSVHQRVWNLRFAACGKCPKKGVLLTRDLRQEDLCVDSSCYGTFEANELRNRLQAQQQAREDLLHELQRMLARDEVEAPHLQLLSFTLMEVVGSVTDGWRSERGLPAHGEVGGADRAWQWLSNASLDDLVTAAIHFSIMLLASGGGHTVRIPAALITDLSTDFGLDEKTLALLGSQAITDETSDVASANVT